MNSTSDAKKLLHSLGRATEALPARPARVLGIDLGTTNSTASQVVVGQGGEGSAQAVTLEIPQMTREGNFIGPLLPSMVAVADAKVYVGEGAKRLRSEAARHRLRPYQSIFYDCKNEIGLQKTYHMAPEGLRSAAEVGSRVLRTLLEAAKEHGETAFDRVVVTVPASFQVAQRTDTIRAAKLAGLELTGGDLLDEPLAAFLDYLVGHQEELVKTLQQPRNLLVFDFGGGTCDVAVFRLRTRGGGGPLGVESLAVSRYHRLGGGDIDAAIVHEHLLPELRRQNALGPHDLTFEDKKRLIEPCLLGTAEALKVSLCSEVRRLKAFGKLDAAAREAMVSKQPVTVGIQWKDRGLQLAQPTLSLKAFEALLAPFLDRTALAATETEYRVTCSIFAPLRDALDRAGLRPKDVDLCLLVGGSSLIPQVADAIAGFLPGASLHTYADAAEVKTCVSRGAAYHALSMAWFGEGLVAPATGDALCLRHRGGHQVLIERGSALPYPPGGGFAEWSGFAIPEASDDDVVSIRIELTTGDDGRVLHSQRVDLDGPAKKGDRLHIQFRIDANQVLHLRVRKAGEPASKARTAVVENPLTNVVNPSTTRQRIEEIEERLRVKKVAAREAPASMAELSAMYAELGQREKAAEYLERAIRMRGTADPLWLGRLAMLYEEMGDVARADQHYQDALRLGNWTGTPFNYAIALRRRGDHARAWDILEPTLKMPVEPPFFVLAAMIRDKLGDPAKARDLVAEALNRFDPVSSLDDWQLGWFETGASLAKDARAESAAKAERRRRATRRPEAAAADAGGALPWLPDAEKETT